MIPKSPKMLAAHVERGIDVQSATTSLRQTMMQILRPTARLRQAIEDLGYASGRAMMETLGFSGAVGLLGEYAEENGVRMEEMFSNVRAVTAVLVARSVEKQGRGR
jgi:hypothetical protein